MKVRMFTLLVIASFVMFVSCGGDDKESVDTFTPAEATTAATDLNSQNTLDQALESMDDAFDFAAGSGVASKVMSKSEGRNMKKDGDFIYNSGTGWWVYNYLITSGTFWNGTVDVRYRFTPRDGSGLPTNLTDKTEYIYSFLVDADTSFSNGGYTVNYSMNFNMLSDMDVTGMVAYDGNTGNLHLNGTHEYGYNYQTSVSSQTVKWIYTLKFTYADVQLSPTGDYPASGTISFTVKRAFTPEVQQLPNYYVAGSITFDGDNTATLILGGQTFQLNLDTGNIIIT